jgi:hypothetical protein
MIGYQTFVPATPPPLRQMADDAAGHLGASPYGGQNHQDVYAALGASQIANLNSYARQAGQQFGNAAQAAQRNLALSGLSQMAQSQQQAQQLQNSRLNMLLGGLL